VPAIFLGHAPPAGYRERLTGAARRALGRAGA